MRRQITLLLIGVLLGLASEVSAKTLLTFEGEVDFLAQKVNVFFEYDQDRSVRAIVEKSDDQAYQILMDIQRIQTPLFDLSTEIKTDLQVVPDERTKKPYIKGNIQSQYALVDYKPVEDFRGTFQFKNRKVYLDSLASKQLSAAGEIDFLKGPMVDMSFDLNNVNLNSFLNFWTRTKSFDSDGLVSGKILASGKLKELVLQGDLEAHEGFIRALEFDHIYLDAEGIYPYLNVSRATVATTDGLSFSLVGPIDLSKRKMFKQQIKDMTITPLVKGNKDAAEWTIRSSKEVEGNATYELKYLLRKDDFEKDHEDKAAGIIGIQRAVEF